MPSPQSSTSPAFMGQLLMVLVLMIACGQMAQTIFVPALPVIGDSLHIGASGLQAIMASYLLAYGLCQFIYGPISDRIGRKVPLLFGIALFILGAIIAANSNQFAQLIVASTLQGMGTAAAGALSRSIPRDHYFGKPLQQFNSYVSMAVVFLPLVAPFIGSVTSAHFGWHGVYYFLAGFGTCVWLVILLAFKDSLPLARRERRPVLASYAIVLRSKAFCGYVLSLVATFAGIAAFEAIAGVLYGQSLQMTPFWVSVYFVAPIPGYLIGALMASKTQSMRKLTNRGIALLGAGALFLLIPGLSGWVIGWSLLVGSTLFFCGAGVLFPTLTTAALEPFPRQAGIAGALLGGLQNFGAGMAALIMSLVPMHGQLSIGLLCAAMVMVVIIALSWVKHCEQDKGVTGANPL
ncbi:multidrug efflux MFS transporter EmrD [Shewanella sp. NIFS-20-20]|uniref:multidrug efflux MFS transporter EmrD n=1 Tax=Shewanella sp. NIFS-20-20 TaxID=2853806 RepID=UPI001C48886B|nr:multidrug efflux MFS transporter EmrD [Shewanella sp. NIFS-20-20]MBV7316346.1 multidrug efflux MFS transporter EmrD [Shewanella sp. NIFS-20-20]